MIKWKLGSYTRRSFDDGETEESDTIKNQRDLIINYVKKEKDLQIVEHYSDDGFTGTDFNRPGFQKLLEDIKDGKINAVIVKDLSRLGRNYIEVGNYLEQIFPLYNIRFIAVNDNIDSFKDPSSVSNVMVSFKNVMNDEYARDISNKVRGTLNTKKENGEFIGSSVPYGYQRDPKDKHKFIIDKEAAMVVKKIFKMILDGKTREEVVDILNKYKILPPRVYKMQGKQYKFKVTEQMKLWDKKKVDKILRNRNYIGDLTQNKKRTISHKIHKVVELQEEEWIIKSNHHVPLISEEDFYHVQDIIYNRDTRIRKDRKYDIFSGHLKCPDCGNTFSIKKSKENEYYYCTTFLKEKTCTNHAVCKKKLEPLILSIINDQVDLIMDINADIEEIIINDENINYDAEILNNRLLEINNNISKYEEFKKSLKVDVLNGYISSEDSINYEKEYDDYLKNYNQEKEKLLKNLKNLGINTTKSKDWVKKFETHNQLEQLTKCVIDELVDNIYIYDKEKIIVDFKYKDEYLEALDFLIGYKCGIISNEIPTN